MIVCPQPASGKFLDFVERFKEMVSQPIVAYGPVVTLDVSILLRLAWLDEIDADSAPGGSGQRHGANVLWAVVAADRIWFAPPFDDSVQRSDDTFGWQREIDLDSQALSIEIIDDVKQADAASVGKLVMHEVHRPALVDCSRHSQWQRLLAHQAVARLDSHIQLEFTVNPVNPFVVPFEIFDIAQVQEAQPEAPIALVVRQPCQPISNDAVFCIQLGLVPVAGLADAECLAGQLDRG